MSPRISVLLPYRNAAATIEEALASVLVQRAVDLEVLALDDGSQDDGPARVARLAADDPRVRCLATGGVGIVGALRAGLAAARAPFLARMDGDDVCHPDRLALQLEWLEQHPTVGALGTQVAGFPDEAVGEGLRRYIAWQNTLLTPAEHARDLFVEAPLCHPSVLLRREALEQVGGWREVPWAEDYDLWLRLDAHGWQLAKVPAVLLHWRHIPGRLTFSHPRYTPERFREVKARFLAPRLHARARPLAVWGAGPTGKRLARALEACGVRAERFVDIDPRKIGGQARGVPIVAPEQLERGAHTVLVAVGARGARDIIRTHLDTLGFVEGDDFLCAS